MNTVHWYLLILLILVLLAGRSKLMEKFWVDRPWLSSDWSYFPGLGWQYFFGSTRNMSYDLRGDPYIPFEMVSPWNNPSRFPIRNRPLIMGW